MKFYLLLLTLFALYAQGQIQTVYAPCTEDTYVQDGSATNYSTLTNTLIDVNGAVKRSYYKFNIASLNIPAGAVIHLARIKVKVLSESSIVSTTFTVQRVIGTWSESTITYGAQPISETYDASSATSITSGYRYFDATPQTRSIMSGAVANNGFCVRRTSEVSATTAASYASSNDPVSKPELEIQYYLPYNVSSAMVNPAATTVSADASILPVITGGPGGTTNYQWYNSSGTAISGATSANLTGRTYGWYGLRISSSTGIGNPVYMAFLVGLKCQEATINFSPGPDYVDDVSYVSGALSYILTSNSVTTSAGYNRISLPEHTGTLMKFRLWISPELDVTQANLNMFGSSHSGTANTALLYRNTQDFNEVSANFMSYTFPGYTTVGGVTIAHKATATANASNIDIKDFWNLWKLNSNENFGLTFRSSTTSGFSSQMQTYHSSDATTAALRPNIQFKVNRPCHPYSYANLRKDLDGGYASTSAGVLKFYFEEAYAIDGGKYLPLKIYNKNRTLIAHVKLDGTIVTGTITAQPYTYDDNRRSLSLASLGLAYGEMYLLEVETSTGEKRYLKFIYKD